MLRLGLVLIVISSGASAMEFALIKEHIMKQCEYRKKACPVTRQVIDDPIMRDYKRQMRIQAQCDSSKPIKKDQKK